MMMPAFFLAEIQMFLNTDVSMFQVVRPFHLKIASLDGPPATACAGVPP